MTDVSDGDTVVLAGTRKGLFVFHSSDRREWKSKGPYFEGLTVRHALLDPRDGRTVWAGVTSSHWGPTVQKSRDFGETWTRGEEGPHFSKESGLSVSKIWQIRPGAGDELWLGTDPAGLFRSDDDGETWTSIDGLNYREDRGDWTPGGGGLCLHTILPHPGDANRVIVGISAVGILSTRDGGETWRVMNGDIRADFLPEKVTSEEMIGSCPHKIVRDAAYPDLLYQQNHCGVYRRHRDDPGWAAIEAGLPSTFGFPMAAHPRDHNTLYIVPLEGDYNRVTADGAMAVYRTRNAGTSWERLTKGLPQKDAWFTVLRDALRTDANDPAGVYGGTTTGQLYGSRDEGDSWRVLAEYLPQVQSVEAGITGG